MKVKKALAWILSAALLVGTLCSCSSQSDTGQAASAGSTGTSTDASDDDIPVIRFGLNQLWSDCRNEQKVEDAMNAILAEKYNVKIDIVLIQMASLQTQMNLALTGGDDAFDVYTSFIYQPMSTLVSNGQAIALDDYLDENAPETMELLSGYPDSILDCCRIGGKLYALPAINTWASSDYYMVRKSFSDRAGVDWDQVNSLDTLTQSLIQLKDANPDSYFIPGATVSYFEPKDIDNLGDTNYLGVITDPANSTTVENYYESDYFLNFLENVKIWKEHDIISPNSMSNNETNLGSLQNGIVEGTTGYGWSVEDALYNMNYTQEGQPMAYGEEIVGAEFTDKYMTTGNVTLTLWHVSPFCEHPDAAVRLLNALYTNPECAMLLANGIEGEDYVYNDDGQLCFPAGQNSRTVGWNSGNGSFLPNSFQLPQWENNSPNYNERVVAANQSAIPSKALGFVCDTEPIADQMAACTNVLAQYYLPLINGEVDIDQVLPVFQQALRDAGIDDIIAEKQAQLDAWLASK